MDLRLITITPAPGQSWPKLHLSSDGVRPVCKSRTVVVRDWGEMDGDYLRHWHEIVGVSLYDGPGLICAHCMVAIGARERTPRIKGKAWFAEREAASTLKKFREWLLSGYTDEAADIVQKLYAEFCEQTP